MKKRIYIYELDCYKVASEEQIQRMRISPERYFNLEGLPSEELAEKLEEFIWERGKMLAPSSMASEVTYYNNIREFPIFILNPFICLFFFTYFINISKALNNKSAPVSFP